MWGNSSSVAPIKHDVFLSFRGEDTRTGFTAHLYAALCRKQIQTLLLNFCRDLELLPNSIGNATLLSELDLSGCDKLSEIPSDIGRELSLHASGIVNLPESIAHLSSLKSLDLCDCKMLESIPQLPPFLKQLLAFDCPSIRRVMPNSRVKLPSDFKEGVFNFHFTKSNGKELDPSAHSNIVADAWLRITNDAYRSVFYCFPGSAVPHWFPYRCKGHSVTVNKDSLNGCNDSRLTGFTLCFVLGIVDMDDTEGRFDDIKYRLTFLPNNQEPIKNTLYWKGRWRSVVQDHTLVWKYNWEYASINLMLSHAHSITFKISV